MKPISMLFELKEIMHTLGGWVIVTVLMFWQFIQPGILSFAIVLVTLLFDFFWGCAASKKINKPILSGRMRDTLVKVAIYGSSLLVVFSIEKSIHEEWFIGTKVICAFAAACELLSASASMLIVKPDMPFLKLFRLQLKGEINKKMGINIDDVLTSEEGGK
jgi:Flp pilus assembly protein TadB